MKRLLLFTALLAVSYVYALADITCRGTVVDEEGEPVIGAVVSPKGMPNRGVPTDIDGNFVIKVPDNSKRLHIDFAGMKPIDVNVAPDVGIVKMEIAKSSVWKRTRFLGLNYVISDFKVGGISVESDMGIALNNGNTYFLHKKPLAGMIKIGLDAVWFDFNVVFFNKNKIGLNAFKIDLGIGVGPSVTLAPFISKGNALSDLRFSLYFHFTPSATVLLAHGDDSGVGISPVLNFGGVAQWKNLGLGAEGRWCSTNYNNGIKASTSSCRLFLRLCF